MGFFNFIYDFIVISGATVLGVGGAFYITSLFVYTKTESILKEAEEEEQNFDEIYREEFDQLENGWQSEVIHENKTQLKTDFISGEWTAEPVVTDEELTSMEGYMFNLMPPGIGPDVLTFGMARTIPDFFELEKGMIKITVAPEDPWAPLIDSDKFVPGYFITVKGARSLSKK